MAKNGHLTERAFTTAQDYLDGFMVEESKEELDTDESLSAGAPNGSVPQNICSSCKFLLAGRCGRNNSPWKESVAGKKIIQGVKGDLKPRIAATGYLYGLLTTQDLNCAL